MKERQGHKAIESLTDKEKDDILKIVFKCCMDNNEYADIGADIFGLLSHEGYLWSNY